MDKIIIKKQEGGYAILFTVVIVGIISVITIGLANAAYKQMVLSSVAKDSTAAFYQADIASECVLYAENEDLLKEISSTFTCGGHELSYTYSVDASGIKKFKLVPTIQDITGKCFRADINKEETADVTTTKIEALGYNICNKTNFRTVERSIEVNY